MDKDNIRYDIEKQLLQFNPLLKNKDVYISGTNNESLSIFYALTWYGHYVKGFVDDNYDGSFIFNKAVLRTKNFIQKHNAVLVDSMCADWNCHDQNLERFAFIINENIRDKIVLYGCGAMGKKTKNFMEKHGISVECFIDSNANPEGMYAYGSKVYGKDCLSNLSDDTTVVITSGNYLEDIYEYCKNYIDYSRLFYCGELLGDIDWIFGFEYGSISGEKLWLDVEKLLIRFNDMKMGSLFIYGNSDLELAIYRFLKLFDFDIKGFINSEKNSLTESNALGTIYDLSEVIYFVNSIVIMVKEEKEVIEKLWMVGLGSVEHYIVFDRITRNEWLRRSNVMDIYLGQSYIGGSAPGFERIGNYENALTKIVLLGGSTTDQTLYSFKSWGDYLYDMIGDHFGILNGGVCGYDSSCELVKLLRDVLILKPDLVIVYDGINETLVDLENEFDNPYSMEIYKYAENYFEKNKLWNKKWGGYGK